MKNNTIKKYSIIFIIFSFLGALLEFLFTKFTNQELFYFDRTFFLLTGIRIPFIPFYGALFVILIALQGFLLRNKIKLIYIGLINGLVMTLWELVWGIVGLKIFNRLLWDYSLQPLNFMGIISLPMSILWIISGYVLAFTYYLINDIILNRLNI